jgi:hypothetical protein
MVDLVCIPPDQVRVIWLRVAPLLKSAIDRTQLSNWDDVANDILAGKSLLWLCIEDERILCAGATALRKTDFGLACVIVACGGADRAKWVHLLAKIEDYAMAEGCKRIRMFGRGGWRRVLKGYRLQSVVLEKEL